MAKEKGSFKEFLSAVAPEYQAFVEKLNNKLIEQGCDLVIKEAKSGYAASYQLEKKTVMNWVFRKSGVLARIYGDNAGKYEDIIASLPAEMQKKMTTSRDCKRLIDPTACSDTCVKGFVYTLNGDTHKKCRNDGMFFLLTNETAEHIARLVCAEVTCVSRLHSDRIVKFDKFRFVRLSIFNFTTSYPHTSGNLKKVIAFFISKFKIGMID